MYNRLFVETCGMFNIWHLLVVLLFFVCLGLMLWLSRRMTPAKVQWTQLVVAILVTVLEIIKIGVRVSRGQAPDSWMPLYYCSLFLFAIWLSLCRWEPLRRMGCAYMSMGGILASILFTFYPSTSLAISPLFSTAVLHSFLYHLVMCYTGLLILTKGSYVPRKRDALHYFLFVFAACILAVFVNGRLDTNCMFMRHPFGLPLLQPLLEYSPLLYMALVSVAQSVLMFWFNFWLYGLVQKKNREV